MSLNRKIDNPTEMYKTMLFDKYNFKYVSPKSKEAFSFLFNRNFSKDYLKEAIILNNSNIDRNLAMDIWSYTVKGVPSNFWKK